MSADLIRDLSILGHLLDYCNDIEEIVNQFGDDYETFQSNRAYKHSISMCVMQIGELTKKLSFDFRSSNAEVEWKAIIGMRNMFAHGYWEMNEEIIWSVVHKNIATVKELCENVLAENQKLIDIHLFGEKSDKFENGLLDELDDELEL